MSIDIGGWVEIANKSAPSKWYGVIQIDALLHGNYDMFGCLFDVMNYTDFPAPAPKRGLPQDISLEGLQYDEAMNEDGGTLWQSWITLAEIKNLDLEEIALDRRAYHYKTNEDGTLVYQNTKSSAPNTPDELYEGLTWEIDGTVYRIQMISRRFIFESAPDWSLLFDMMRSLERFHSDDQIRLVVWFW